MLYYAMSDDFTGSNPREYTGGFANTKIPLAFRSKRERDEWLATTRLLTARKITRTEALKLARYDRYEGRKFIAVYGAEEDNFYFFR